MSNHPTDPTGEPPPAPDGRPDRIGLVVSAVIGIVSLALTLAVTAFTSDENPASDVLATAPPATPPSDLGRLCADVSPVPLSELKRSFPLPPGAGPSHVDPDLLMPWTRAYDVRAPLRRVRAFYESRLRELGYGWCAPYPSRSGGRIVGWRDSIWRGRTEVGLLSIYRNLGGGAPGVVTIQVMLDG